MGKSYCKILLSILLAVCLVESRTIDPSRVVVAINCGSKTEEVTPSEGSFKYVPVISA